MRNKKIRGLKRRQKTIDQWFEYHKNVDFEYLEQNNSYYVKTEIDPWWNLLTTSKYPSNYRKQLFSKLLNIYDLWRQQMQSNYDNFYLAIWVFDNRFIHSQVVTAIGERIEYYDNMWLHHEKSLKFPIYLFKEESARTNEYTWKSADDEDLLPESYFLDASIQEYHSAKHYYEDQRYYKRLLKRDTPTRMIRDNHGENPEKVFRVKRGNCWIGKRK